MVLFAFLAGLVSVLSPCVLPLLPIVLASAAGTHRMGPLALAIGVAVSFTVIGLFIATIGFAIGLDGGAFRMAGAAILIAIGAVLLVPGLQERVVTAAGPISGWSDRTFGGFDTSGWQGQLGLGLLLGLVWSPCVGPTLGAASLLASQGKDLGMVALAMAAFGLGAAIPLLALGLISRETMMAWRGQMMNAGKGGKLALGAILVTLGILIASGLDKRLEAALVAISPDWLTAITTQF
jgi:cytochrome c-type biogenesis protein